MRLEFFIITQFISMLMGFLLGRALSEHERANYEQHNINTDISDYRCNNTRPDVSNNRHDDHIEGGDET